MEDIKNNIVEEELTEQEKEKLLNLWNSRPDNPPSLKELSLLVGCDSRSKKGRKVREFLANREIKAKSSNFYSNKEKDSVLTNEHKEFIRNNYSLNKSGLQLGRELFNDALLTLDDPKIQEINAFIHAELRKVTSDNSDSEDFANETWTPPKKIEHIIKKVNKYINKSFDLEKLNTRQKNDFEALIRFLNTYRFIYHINNFESINDRIFFESEFIRCVYDKPDLTEEEIDQYIVYSLEVVMGKNICRIIDVYQREQDKLLKNGEKMNMYLVETISNSRREWNDCSARQQKLLASLTQKRSERISSKTRENASVLNLVNEWKTQEGREKLLKLAELRKQSLKTEYKRLDSIEEFKAKILGVNESLLVDG